MGPPVGVGGGVDVGGDRGVHGPPQLGGRTAVDRGADQRVAEDHVRVHAEQPAGDHGVLGGADVGDAIEVGSDSPYECGVAEVSAAAISANSWAGSSSARTWRRKCSSKRGRWERLAHGAAAPELVVGQVRCQFEKRQGQPLVAATTRRARSASTSTSVRVERRSRAASSGRPSTAIVGRPPRASEARSPSRTPKSSPMRSIEQAAPDERQRGQRLLVDPLGVVDHAEQALVDRHLGQQGEACEPDEEAVGRPLVVEAEGRGQRASAEGPGSAARRSRNGRSSRCRPVYPRSRSASTPATQTLRTSAAEPTAYWSRRSSPSRPRRARRTPGRRHSPPRRPTRRAPAARRRDPAGSARRPVWAVPWWGPSRSCPGSAPSGRLPPVWTDTSGRKVVEVPAIAAVLPGTVRTPPVRVSTTDGRDDYAVRVGRPSTSDSYGRGDPITSIPRSRGGPPMSEKPTIVLVHGGFVDGSGWQAVYELLSRGRLQRQHRAEPDPVARRRRRRHQAGARPPGRARRPRRPLLRRRRHHRGRHRTTAWQRSSTSPRSPPTRASR